MIPRQAEHITLEKAKSYPIVAITGPRQSGKSTLAKALFPHKPYCSLEDIDQRQFAHEDPRLFLNQFPDGAILDEIQHCPQLFSYIQTISDAKQQMGLFILTGSQQFQLLESITQSLAGRAGLIQLLPFSWSELKCTETPPDQLEQVLYRGAYPPIHNRQASPLHWYTDYITTYLERDVRQITNVHNLATFHRFLKMCAARIGQLVNLSSLANDCGITHNTARAWLSVLEASYIVFLLQPHHQNYNKRLIKSPKLYFYDTGLACSLLNIENPSQLTTHAMRGGLYESWVISELLKQRFNRGLSSNLYFWRDSQGHEVDIIIEQAENLTAIEVKSGMTLARDQLKGLQYWEALTGRQDTLLVYGGKQPSQRGTTKILGWPQVTGIAP